MWKTGVNTIFPMIKEIFNEQLYGKQICQEKDFRLSRSENKMRNKYLLMVSGTDSSLQLTT